MVICEDDFIFRNMLKDYITIILSNFTNQFEVLEFSSGEELLSCYPEGIDIFFLDIDMDKITGMDVARKIREIDSKTEIIFTTAVAEYVQDGYEVRAYRYLIKPIDFNELKKHLVSCIDDIIHKSKHNLLINNKNGVYKIPVCDITYIEVINKDIIVHTMDKNYTIKMSMSNIEKELERYNFFRCHKSYLINMNHIQCVKGNSVIINNQYIPISRHRSKNFKIKLVNILGDIIC